MQIAWPFVIAEGPSFCNHFASILQDRSSDCNINIGFSTQKKIITSCLQTTEPHCLQKGRLAFSTLAEIGIRTQARCPFSAQSMENIKHSLANQGLDAVEHIPQIPWIFPASCGGASSSGAGDAKWSPACPDLWQPLFVASSSGRMQECMGISPSLSISWQRALAVCEATTETPPTASSQHTFFTRASLMRSNR